MIHKKNVKKLRIATEKIEQRLLQGFGDTECRLTVFYNRVISFNPLTAGSAYIRVLIFLLAH